MTANAKKTRNFRYLIISLSVLALLAIYFFGVRKDMTDFGVCYKAGERIRQGETLYRLSDEHLQYKYAPASAAFFAVLTLSPYAGAKLLWYILELFCLVISFSFFYRILPLKKKTKGILAMWCFLILAKFLGREVELGQVNLLLIALLAAALCLFLEEKDFPAGLLWGVSLFFKPYALVFLPYFGIKKRWKILLAGSLVLALGFIMPALFFGLEGNIRVHQEWTSTLSRSTPGLLTSYDNASLYAFILKFFSGRAEAHLRTLVVIAVLAAAALFFWMIKSGRKDSLPQPEVLEAAVLFLFIPLLSPLGWYYNYLYALAAVMMILNSLEKFPSGLRSALIINFVVVGGSLRETLGKVLFSFYTKSSLVVVSFLFIVFCLFYLRAKKFS